jgi:hypothetical protein
MKKQTVQKLRISKTTLMNLAQMQTLKGGATALCTRRITRCDSFCEVCISILDCSGPVICV